MKKKYIWYALVLTLVIIFLLDYFSANNTRIYKGEGSDWEGIYEYKETSTGGYKYVFQITFKNDISELSELKDITIKYKADSGDTGGTIPIMLVEDGTFISSGEYEGTSLLREDSKIEVYVNWGTNEDSFVLEYNE